MPMYCVVAQRRDRTTHARTHVFLGDFNTVTREITNLRVTTVAVAAALTSPLSKMRVHIDDVRGAWLKAVHQILVEVDPADCPGGCLDDLPELPDLARG